MIYSDGRVIEVGAKNSVDVGPGVSHKHNGSLCGLLDLTT